MRAEAVKSFYHNFNLERAIESTSPEMKRFLTEELRFVRENIPPGKKVLEVGCGYGRIMDAVCGRSARTVGIDFCRPCLEKAESYLKGKRNVELHHMEAHDIRLPDGSFDYTLCMYSTFGNMPDMEEAVLREMARVTKRGGSVIISVYSEHAKDAQHKSYRNAGLNIKDDGTAVTSDEGLYSRRFTKNDLRLLFRSAGLECTTKKLCSIGHIAVAVKK